MPLFVGGKDAVEKSGFDAEAAAANQTAFFDELSRALNESGAQILYTLSLTNLLQQPLIDYAAGQVYLDTEPVRQALETEKTLPRASSTFSTVMTRRRSMRWRPTLLGAVEMSNGALSILRPFAAQGAGFRPGCSQ